MHAHISPVAATEDVITAFNIQCKREVSHMYMVAGNTEMWVIFMCNNNVQYVFSHKLGYYLGNYQTKSNKENQHSFAAATSRLKNHIQKHGSGDGGINERTHFSIGFGRFCASAYGHTSGEVIGAPLAAYLLNGGDTFVYSHPLSRLPVQQGIAHLLCNPLYAGINKKGQCTASVLDYRFRCQAMSGLEWWMLQKMWELVQRNVKQSTVSPAATAVDAGNSDDAATREGGQADGGESDDAAAAEEEQDDETDERENDYEDIEVLPSLLLTFKTHSPL